MKDWKGNTKSTYVTLGASNHSEHERENNDYYATDPKALEILLKRIKQDDITLNNNIWECACGEGHLSKILIENNYNVTSTDLIDRGYGESGQDFLKTDCEFDGDILTNPPYKYAQEFVEHALSAINEGNKVVMFLKIQFLEGQAITPHQVEQEIKHNSTISDEPFADFGESVELSEDDIAF